jgi:hypothetical protein
MRLASIIFATASLLIPAAWIYATIVGAEREVQARGGPICGMPALANFILALLLCVLLSAVAFVLGVVAYRRVSPPRPRRRLLELSALVLPFLLVGSYLAAFLFWP